MEPNQRQSTVELYPVIEVRGTPRQMGRQHGEQAKERILMMLEFVFGRTTRRMIGGADGTPPVECDLITHAESLLPVMERYAPDLVEECRGIAEGAMHDFREIFAMQYFIDFNVIPASPQPSSAACSSVVAVNGAHREGHVLLGWNDDMAVDLAKTSVILRSFPDHGPAITGICYAGTIPECGTTRERVMAGNSLICPHAAARGVSYLFITRKALQQETLLQSVQVILDAPRISGMNFVVVDRSGEFVNIETTCAEHRLTETREDCYAHTNHFQASEFAARKDYCPQAMGTSKIRQLSLERFLRRQNGRIDWDSMKQALCNHPSGLCVHNTDGMTITCMLCDLTAGRVAFSSGPPCQGRFQEFNL